MFLIGMAADWLLGLPSAGRVVILVALLAVAFYKAWRCGWRHLHRFDASRTALRKLHCSGNTHALKFNA